MAFTGLRKGAEKIMASAYEVKKNEFLNSTVPPAFSCIKNTRQDRDNFVDALDKRRKDPLLIHQQETSLCGPAAFMYCIAREKPDDYGIYVLDLAMTGKGRLGKLEAAPEAGCRNASVGKIAPVDWVALGGLRDSPGARLDKHDSQWSGMTRGATLAGWFKDTGWFEASNVTDFIPSRSRPLDDLLRINMLPAGYVCLLLNSKVLTGKPTTWNGATHWVVLGDGDGKGGGTNGNCGTRIRIQASNTIITDYLHRKVMTCPISETPTPVGNEVVTPAGFDIPIIDEKKRKRKRELEQGKLDFLMYTWGGNRTVDKMHPNLTVEEFLKYYFGYVSARLVSK
jgi:hypothetical protein